MGWRSRPRRTKKAAKAEPTATASIPTTAAEDQPWPGASMIPMVRPTRPAETRTAPEHVDGPVAVGVRRLGDVAGGHDHHHDRDGEVDEEDEAPGDGADEEAPDEGADGGGDPAEPRPGADGPALVVGGERGLEDGQRPGVSRAAPTPWRARPAMRTAGVGGEGAHQ